MLASIPRRCPIGQVITDPVPPGLMVGMQFNIKIANTNLHAVRIVVERRGGVCGDAHRRLADGRLAT